MFSVSVMAYRAREKYFDYLKEKLGDVPFSIDEIVGTDGHIGLWPNCKRAWRMADMSKDWHIVLQDDSIICEDFYNRVQSMLQKIGDQDFVISLYAGNRLKNRIDRAIEKRDDKVIYSSILNENALCMRTKHIEEMIRYCDIRDAQSDRVIQSFARRKGLIIYYPIPSLIDHRSDRSIYRDVYNKPLPDSVRHAYWFIDDEKPAITNKKY